ncbi:DUF2252 domain-containing protein [Secundilactobacillus mixtipabuli]|uniref:DUF2252 domain-containing protein n=1 Tax=Secundilactobacillus mixtipabuli TaxID=1435342 RepID=A0A1Z5IB17_9LACO|nr:DUF2252 domain-containing protein [Secundilactobacillus mixtipabuli]GAW98939.1 hypothetical protein IWT30_00899 [Secundilactobacillus mixtipabuli]
MSVKPFDFSQLVVQQSLKEQRKFGKKLRQAYPFEALGEYVPAQRDPNQLMNEVRSILIPELLPERTQRMSQSSFTFFRGTAELMEYDLAHQDNSPIHTVSCGDAHIGNFGFFGSPERQLLFDLNDFDEAGINPFEWDLKRLAVSTLLAGQEHQFEAEKLNGLVNELGESYRKCLQNMFEKTALNRFYPVNSVENILNTIPSKVMHTEKLMKFLSKAGKRDSEQVVRKFTVTDSKGQISFRENPPRTQHVKDQVTKHIAKYLTQYRQTLATDVSLMLSQYHVTDIVRHSVGVGSFGSLCYLLLLTGTDDSHLVLQIKEALPHRQLADQLDEESVQYELNEGKRIVDCQKILQSASDPFLGYFATEKKSFYVRQFRDMKASIELSELDWDQFEAYAKTCAWVLGIAHAQSPTAGVILGYTGHSEKFDSAIQNWTAAYVQQVEQDFEAFKQYRL